MIKVAVVGYGHVGQSSIEAVLAASDMELVGVVRRGAKALNPEHAQYPVVDKVEDLDVKPDVAILATPTRSVPELALEYLKKGISCVDSFDIHTDILQLKKSCDPVAKENGVVAVHSAGWDPGSDSVVRALMQAAAPRGITYTNFGPGMSMGHSVAAKSKEGVYDALSMTIPLGTSVHRRMVYVQLEEGADENAVREAILTDPYFSHDESHVIFVDNVADLIDVGHGVNMVRKAGVGRSHNQVFEFNMSINNPDLTGQMLVCVARASQIAQPGAYTMIELPVIDLLEGDKDELISSLV